MSTAAMTWHSGDFEATMKSDSSCGTAEVIDDQSNIVVPEHLLGFELRRIEFPMDASMWQVAAWLEAQASIWDEMDSLLDDKRYDHIYYFAREQAGYGKKMFQLLALVGDGSFPGNLVDVIRHLSDTIYKCEIPILD